MEFEELNPHRSDLDEDRQYEDGTTQSLQDYYVPRGISRNLTRIQAYMDKVNSGEKKISAKQWPSMFYDMSLYDPKNKKQGFLRSRVVIQAWRHIFTGPLSAVSKERTGCPSKPRKGRMHHLTEPGARNILYVICQISFSVSSAEAWTSVIGTMDLAELYYKSLDLVELYADEQWVKDLLKFWKDEAPGTIEKRLFKRCRVLQPLMSLGPRTTWMTSFEMTMFLKMILTMDVTDTRDIEAPMLASTTMLSRLPNAKTLVKVMTVANMTTVANVTIEAGLPHAAGGSYAPGTPHLPLERPSLELSTLSPPLSSSPARRHTARGRSRGRGKAMSRH
ncbi:hypothetical protein K503DRAFT_865273 [Rhizopogon vinicolor AM-OR11-026]|uniref:Uncharacterized protein n=1 Tax=Rhizopogon vinicolor AM-OR11-026 TaxID=1314800 RepID=A0A1B7N470_9AGAM|nr:hypothetical protein K503DRAFT_865273 [Rhizopogon vinicolor AM-OR11-026]